MLHFLENVQKLITLLAESDKNQGIAEFRNRTSSIASKNGKHNQRQIRPKSKKLLFGL